MGLKTWGAVNEVGPVFTGLSAENRPLRPGAFAPKSAGIDRAAGPVSPPPAAWRLPSMFDTLAVAQQLAGTGHAR